MNRMGYTITKLQSEMIQKLKKEDPQDREISFSPILLTETS